MATIQVCDGCREPLTEASARGLVIVCQYCPKCAAVADDFIRCRDELHTRLAQEWDVGIRALGERFGASLAVLPDHSVKPKDAAT